MKNKPTYSNLLMRFPVFDGVSAEVLSAIDGELSVKRVRKGSTLYDICQPTEYVYFLTRGKILLTYPSKDGKSPLIYILSENSILGELEAFQNLARLAHASAMEDSELLVIKKDYWVALYRGNLSVANNIIEHLSSNLSRLLEAYSRAITQSVESRLAGLLLQFYTRFREPNTSDTGSAIPFHLPHDELAKMIGTTRTTIHKLMTAWKNEGVLDFRYGRISILKPERLHEVNGGHPDSSLN
jgi:CRP-like cAMP-binding protein